MAGDLGRQYLARILRNFNDVCNISHVGEEICFQNESLGSLCRQGETQSSVRAPGCLAVCQSFLGKPWYWGTWVWGQKELYG